MLLGGFIIKIKVILFSKHKIDNPGSRREEVNSDFKTKEGWVNFYLFCKVYFAITFAIYCRKKNLSGIQFKGSFYTDKVGGRREGTLTGERIYLSQLILETPLC